MELVDVVVPRSEIAKFVRKVKEISGEHGIGFDKKIYLSIGIDSALLNIMKGIKRAFDPNNILNPGKILIWKFSI
ncbi:hypothetical protein ES703_122494 [subsurface metagenome]